MVKVIAGRKGSGKTKQLIDLVNEAAKDDSGSIVCLEMGRKLIYDISHAVRLIDCTQESIAGSDGLKGFICGLHAGNYDISHIFFDGLYKLAGPMSPDKTEKFLNWLEEYGEKNLVSFTMTISSDADELSAGARKYILEPVGV